MKWVSRVILACLCGLAPHGAFAHPLADRNFDRGVQVVVTPTEVRVEYELGISDLTMTTELLALVEPGQVPLDAQAASRLYAKTLEPILGRGMILLVAGAEHPLELVQSVEPVWTDHVQFKFIYRCPLAADQKAVSVALHDTNFEGETGYRRMALEAKPGVELLESSAATSLAAIPLTPLWQMTPEQQDASRRIEAKFRLKAIIEPTSASETQPAERTPAVLTDVSMPAAANADRQLRTLLENEQANGWFWPMVLLIAFGLGSVHALKPGHGKTMVAAYLVGEQGTVYHALILGLVTTLTHTGSVLFVALMLGSLSKYHSIDQRQLGFWLTFVSGLLIAALGAALFLRRLQGQEDLLHVHGVGGHVHLPDGSIEWMNGATPSEHVHCHAPRRGAGVAVRTSNLVALGVSGGLVPCDDAVILLLAAVGAGLLAKAVYILLAFSAGLAFVLVAIGILVVKVKGFALQGRGAGPWPRRLQVISASLVTLIGVTICWQAFAIV